MVHLKSNEPVVSLSLDLLIPNTYQPRKSFNDNTLNELALSIREYGVINPILVRQQGDKYEIIAGERRVRAAKKAGLKEIPAIIRNIEDNKLAELALIENLQRENITPIEEAESYREILKLSNITEEKLSEMIGKSQSSISNKIRLLNLPDNIKNALLERKISERHARSLLAIKDEKKQTQLLEKILTEKLTVKELENIISNEKINDEQKNSSEIKKEEKESENMNNESFFPNFNNNNLDPNSMSLNAMNMQAAGANIAPQVEITPMNQQPMMEQPININAPQFEQPTQQIVPDMSVNSQSQEIVGITPNVNEQSVSPIPDFGINNPIPSAPEQVVETIPVTEPQQSILPDNSATPSQPAPTMDPLNNIPLFNNENSLPSVAPSPVTPDMNISNEVEQPVSNEPIAPMVDPPLFTNQEINPISPVQNNVENAMSEAAYEVPVTTTPVQEVDKFMQVKDLLNNNGIEYKAYSNETGHCIIIEF